MDTDRPHEDVAGVGLLTDPARRSLYDFVAEQHAPVTREEAASATARKAWQRSAKSATPAAAC